MGLVEVCTVPWNLNGKQWAVALFIALVRYFLVAQVNYTSTSMLFNVCLLDGWMG